MSGLGLICALWLCGTRGAAVAEAVVVELLDVLAGPLFGVHALAAKVEVDEDSNNDDGEDTTGEIGQWLARRAREVFDLASGREGSQDIPYGADDDGGGVCAGVGQGTHVTAFFVDAVLVLAHCQLRRDGRRSPAGEMLEGRHDGRDIERWLLVEILVWCSREDKCRRD